MHCRAFGSVQQLVRVTETLTTLPDVWCQAEGWSFSCNHTSLYRLLGALFTLLHANMQTAKGELDLVWDAVRGQTVGCISGILCMVKWLAAVLGYCARENDWLHFFPRQRRARIVGQRCGCWSAACSATAWSLCGLCTRPTGFRTWSSAFTTHGNQCSPM